MPERLRLQKPSGVALLITRHALVGHKICYIVTANKRHGYPHRRSAIVYIGTSECGLRRMTESAAERAGILFDRHGITDLSFHVVQCTRRQRLRSWKSLEHALLLVFKRLCGQQPLACTQGKGNVEHWQSDLDRFNEDSIRTLLETYENPS